MKLSKRGEFQIIEYLRQQGRSSPELIYGIGDDCAVARVPADEELLTTTDLLTEGVHFNLDWTDLHHLGRKAVSVNVSDLAAMGARPRFIFLSLAIPDNLGTDQIDQLLSGFLDACDNYGIILAGGDTCRSQTGLTISVSAQGTTDRAAAIMRSGAIAGDMLFVTGSLGDSALALQHLQAGEEPDPFFLGRHINPSARVEVGRELAATVFPTAMIDISDGLLADLEHILALSGVGAIVEEQSIPLSDPFRLELEKNPKLMELALTGGEDYELLFTVAGESSGAVLQAAQKCGVAITKIGKIVAKSDGLRLVDRLGERDLPRNRGYKHFPEAP